MNDAKGGGSGSAFRFWTALLGLMMPLLPVLAGAELILLSREWVAEGDLYAITRSGSTMVAVGEAGLVCRRTNGTWAVEVSGTMENLVAVATGGGRFIAAGPGGTILRSTDAGWVQCVSGTTANLRGVAYGAGTWVVVGADGTILSSADGGVNWFPRASGTTASLNSVAFANGVFACVGIRSANGVNWQPYHSGYPASRIYSDGPRFVTVGPKTPYVNVVAVAPDALNWSLVFEPHDPPYAMARGDGGSIMLGDIVLDLPWNGDHPFTQLSQSIHFFGDDGSHCYLGSVVHTGNGNWRKLSALTEDGAGGCVGVGYDGFIATFGASSIKVADFVVTATTTHAPSTGNGYRFEQLSVDGVVERRLFLHDHHFLTIVDAGGTFALRPRPGVDRNGFGSTLYLQPFMAAAELKGAAVTRIVATPGGIEVDAGGTVSLGGASTYGTWNITGLRFTYDPAAKVITADGNYQIGLDGLIANAGGDLNLYKLASNYLDDVPLTDGSAGDTGDMGGAVVSWDHAPYTWIPPDQPAHFPGPKTDNLVITSTGAFNRVENGSLGFCPIQTAYKPSVTVGLAAGASGYDLIPGFVYNTGQRYLFYADNVGITPVITSASPLTGFTYAVSFRSEALPGDGEGKDFVMTARVTGAAPRHLDVFWSPRPDAYAIKTLVGHMFSSGGNSYEGSFAVPRPPEDAARRGFLWVRPPCN